jgi:hypothetical protein
MLRQFDRPIRAESGTETRALRRNTRAPRQTYVIEVGPVSVGDRKPSLFEQEVEGEDREDRRHM